jgi:hypothetical protein
MGEVRKSDYANKAHRSGFWQRRNRPSTAWKHSRFPLHWRRSVSGRYLCLESLPITLPKLRDHSVLSRCHVSSRFSATPFVFSAWRTVVLPAERPEFRCDSTGTCSWPVTRFVAAPEVETAAFVRIWRIRYPSEFGTDLVDRGIGARHRSFFRFSSSTLEFIRCSLHHGFRSHVAAEHMGLVFRREWCTLQ